MQERMKRKFSRIVASYYFPCGTKVDHSFDNHFNDI